MVPWLRSRRLWGAVGAAVVLMAAGVYLARRSAERRPYKRADFLLGTFVEITAYGPRAEEGVERAFAAMREVERLADPRREGSDLYRLNQNAGRNPVELDSRTIRLLALARTWHARSGGAFDVTVAPLVRAWGFDPEGTPRLPEPRAIAAARALVGGNDLVVDARRKTAFLRRPGMAVDLGAVAKGYAVDQAYAALRKAGVASALINGGGSSIRVLGSPPDRDLWRIGLAHPRSDGRAFLAVLLLKPGQSVGTSADNQRFFTAGGRRYSHIINPATGYPADEAILFSVVGRTAVLTDLLSTACFVRGPADGLELARSTGTEALVYTSARKIKSTPGLRAEDMAP